MYTPKIGRHEQTKRKAGAMNKLNHMWQWSSLQRPLPTDHGSWQRTDLRWVYVYRVQPQPADGALVVQMIVPLCSKSSIEPPVEGRIHCPHSCEGPEN